MNEIGNEQEWLVLYELAAEPGKGSRCEKCSQRGLSGEFHDGEDADVCVVYGWEEESGVEIETTRCGREECVPVDPPVMAQGEQ